MARARRIWTPADTATLERMQGRPDREIAEATGQPIWKVREMRQAQGFKGCSGDRSHWSRRDWLLAGATGLDICPALLPR
jgi:hypothetical protein